MAAYVITRVSGVSGSSASSRVDSVERVSGIYASERVQPNRVTDTTIYDMDLSYSSSSRKNAPKCMFSQYLKDAAEKQAELDLRPAQSFKDGVRMLAFSNYFIVP